MENKYKKINIRNPATLDDFNARFEASMQILNGPDGRRRVEALFDACGKITGKRPIAGRSF